jgi:hypothetical protein
VGALKDHIGGQLNRASLFSYYMSIPILISAIHDINEYIYIRNFHFSEDKAIKGRFVKGSVCIAIRDNECKYIY